MLHFARDVRHFAFCVQFLDLCVKFRKKKRQSFENVCKLLKKTCNKYSTAYTYKLQLQMKLHKIEFRCTMYSTSVAVRKKTPEKCDGEEHETEMNSEHTASE